MAVPAGYTVQIGTRLGDPIAAGVPAYANNGTDTNFAQRGGDHHDAMAYFGLNAAGTARDEASNTRGLLVINYENISEQYLHVNGPTNVGGARPEAEAIKEIEAHGVAVVEIAEGANRTWSYNQASSYIVGGCYAHLAEHPDGGGWWYPGPTYPYAGEPAMSWQDVISSIYIE